MNWIVRPVSIMLNWMNLSNIPKLLPYIVGMFANFLKRVMNPDKPVEDFLNAYFNAQKSEIEKSVSSSTKLE